jgi:hypothetical protein
MSATDVGEGVAVVVDATPVPVAVSSGFKISEIKSVLVRIAVEFIFPKDF